MQFGHAGGYNLGTCYATENSSQIRYIFWVERLEVVGFLLLQMRLFHPALQQQSGWLVLGPHSVMCVRFGNSGELLW